MLENTRIKSSVKWLSPKIPTKELLSLNLPLALYSLLYSTIKCPTYIYITSNSVDYKTYAVHYICTHLSIL